MTITTTTAHRVITPDSPGWPRQLNDLPDPPRQLWVLGTPPLTDATRHAVGMVGARAATDYGQHTATTMATDLGERGYGTVSGLAYGIDGAAHRGSMAAHVPTVAVMAGGVDVPYPHDHASLRAAILDQGGLVVSEYEPGTTPNRQRFLDRNRLIAALSGALVVVEAARRSGSMVTARIAGELDRPVCAAPGPVTSAASAGTHQLIRDGQARLVTSAEDVLAEV